MAEKVDYKRRRDALGECGKEKESKKAINEEFEGGKHVKNGIIC